MNFSGNIPNVSQSVSLRMAWNKNAENMKNLEHGPHACFGAYGRPQQHKC